MAVDYAGKEITVGALVVYATGGGGSGDLEHGVVLSVENKENTRHYWRERVSMRIARMEPVGHYAQGEYIVDNWNLKKVRCESPFRMLVITDDTLFGGTKEWIWQLIQLRDRVLRGEEV